MENYMNENLKQVVEAATYIAASHPDAFDQVIKSIVLECAKVCEELQFSIEGPSPEVKYQRALCAEAIKSHFGIYK